MRPKTQTIDASSIADIAFLLLAFIILSTTLEPEKGIPSRLPEKKTDVPISKPINERNVLEVRINKDNQIMIEQECGKSLLDVRLTTIEFLTNKNNSPDFPKMDEVNEASCKQNRSKLTQEIKLGLIHKKEELELWEKRYEEFKILGDYRTVNKNAIIFIQYDEETSYGQYLGVRDELMSGINQLRNQLAVEKFGVSYHELISKREAVKTAEDMKMIRVVRTVYPQKIIKKKG